MDTLFLGALRPARGPKALTRLLTGGLLAALVAAGATLGAEAPATAVAATQASTQVSSKARAHPALVPGAYEKRVQYWVNRKRAGHDLRKVRTAGCADSSAERWSSYLAVNDLFYHQSMEDLLVRCDASYAGETLGRGAISPRRLVKMWMHSDGHRHVLLSHKARRIGIGAKPDAYGRWVVAANFMRF